MTNLRIYETLTCAKVNAGGDDISSTLATTNTGLTDHVDQRSTQISTNETLTLRTRHASHNTMKQPSTVLAGLAR